MVGLRDGTGHACTPRYEDGSKEGCKQEGSPGPGRLGLSGPRDLSWTEAGVLCHPPPPTWAVVILKALPLRDRKGELGTPPPVPLYFFIKKKIRGPCCVACMQNFSDQGWNPSACIGSVES